AQESYTHTRREAGRRTVSERGASWQVARRPGQGYARSDLALQVRRHLQLALTFPQLVPHGQSHLPVAKPSARSRVEQAFSVAIRRRRAGWRLRFAGINKGCSRAANCWFAPPRRLPPRASAASQSLIFPAPPTVR